MPSVAPSLDRNFTGFFLRQGIKTGEMTPEFVGGDVDGLCSLTVRCAELPSCPASGNIILRLICNESRCIGSPVKNA